jgi:hypothetical protein
MSGQQRYSDDEFDRALRELAEGTAGEPRFREASAAERARQARQQAKRARKQAKPRRGRGRTERGRGRATAWTSVGVVLVLAAAGTFAWTQLRHPSTVSAGRSVVPTIASVVPTIADDGPPALPFASTPAKNWADGADGIVVPAAKPVGEFTAAQVASAYQTAKELLIAADLNKPTLLAGRPTAFADLLTSQQRAQFLGDLNKQGVNKAGDPLSTRGWVTSFAPGTTELVGNVIKVQGAMSAASVSNSGRIVLAISFNYIFAYAVEPPGNPADWMRVVTHLRGSFDFAQWYDPGGPLQPWDVRTALDQAGGLCGTTDGYLHPDYPSERGPGAHPSPSGPALNPYSLATHFSAGCSRSTGT